MTGRFEAFYTDGRSAARQRVTVLPGVEGLHIHAAEGARLAAWPYRGLRVLEEVYPDQPVRFGHRAHGEATLTFEEGRVLADLERVAGRKLGGAGWLHIPPRLAFAALTVSLVFVAGLFLALPRLAGPLAALVPPAWEEALGERVVDEVTAGHPFCEAPGGVAALDTLTARLTAHADAPYPFRVRVSSLPGVNAFAAPGGQIVLLRELIRTARSPEEVAGVLAHEIAHGAERHPMQGLLRALGLQLLFSALLGDAGALEAAAGRFGQLLLVFSYTREDELAADRVGAALLNRAGLRGDGLVTFFRRLESERQGQAGLPRLLSTHPLTEERIARLETLATGAGPAMSKSEWAALRAICGPE
jgi:predicted Zn-dependent protease